MFSYIMISADIFSILANMITYLLYKHMGHFFPLQFVPFQLKKTKLEVQCSGFSLLGLAFS